MNPRVAIIAALALSGCATQDGQVRIHPPVVTSVGLTGSMKPFFIGGEMIYVTHCDFDKVAIGDVVVVWWAGRELNVIHRLIGRKSDGSMITKGDANPERDSHITAEKDFVGCITISP